MEPRRTPIQVTPLDRPRLVSVSRDGSELVKPEPNQALFEDVYGQMHSLHTRWRIYVTFFGSRDAVGIARSVAPHTFGQLQAILSAAIILGIDQLLESHGHKTPASMAILVARMPETDAVLQRTLRRRLGRLRAQCKAISAQRNQLLAHRDLEAILDPSLLNAPTVRSVRMAITELSSILDELSAKHHGGMSCAFSPDTDPDVFDADVLLASLRAGK